MGAPALTEKQRAERWQQVILEFRSLGAPFSEFNVLVALSASLLSGARIEPAFQALANAVIAKALIGGQLPRKQDGRRAGSLPGGTLSYDEVAVAGDFFDLVDGGETTENAVEILSEKYAKSGRQILRIVGKGKVWHGDSPAAREQERRFPSYAIADSAACQDDSPAELAGLSAGVALERLDSQIRPGRE